MSSAEQIAALRADVLAVVPQNWLHPLLTGPRCVVVRDAPSDKQIERLCNQIREDLSAVLSAHGIEVAPNQGPRHADGAGSNPELRAQHRQDSLPTDQSAEGTWFRMWEIADADRQRLHAALALVVGKHLDMVALRRSHCKDAAIIEDALSGGRRGK